MLSPKCQKIKFYVMIIRKKRVGFFAGHEVREKCLKLGKIPFQII